ncbi:PD40 domain-containing protein [candidate division WOR-3 bacterium]|nr:PD40 domain-containing protein [candidate division WOR-3 bacterium]
MKVALILICLVITGCYDKDVKLTEEQLTNTIAFAAYPHHTGITTPEFYNEIYIVKAEPGSQPIRLTHNSQEEERPAWVNDGKSLVFKRCIGRLGSHREKWYLYKMELTTSRCRRLLQTDWGTEIQGKMNLYVLVPFPEPTLYVYDNATDTIRGLFTAEDLGLAVPGWSGAMTKFSIDSRENRIALTIAEGRRLVGRKSAHDEFKCYELAVVNRNGTDFQILTNDTISDFWPTISPDGEFIAFTSERDGYDDIFIMEIASRKIRRLTDPPMHGYCPTWSPDGKKIAFISDRDGFAHIWVINADGTGLFQLTKGDFHVHWTGISWSPRQ